MKKYYNEFLDSSIDDNWFEQEKGENDMFDIAIQFMVQLVSLIPAVLAIYILFDLIGSLLFGKN